LQRFLLGAVLTVAAGFIAWFAASLFAARYLVPAQGGFEGAATVVVSGMVAALVAILAAIVTAWRAPLRTLTAATIIAVVCGIGSASLLKTLVGGSDPVEQILPQPPTQLPSTE
jgi:hypothetical protein